MSGKGLPASADSQYTIAITKAGKQTKRSTFLKQVYKGKDDRMIPYQFLVPESLNTDHMYPLLVFLHGAGELGDDNSRQTVNFPENFLSEESMRDYPCFVIAPQCPGTDAWVSFPDYPENTKTTLDPTAAAVITIELIERLLKEYNIDGRRIYITGISLGGEGTFDMAGRRPDLFAAAVPICGIADPDKAARMKEVPFWIFHGEKDDINPVKYSRMIFKILTDLGGSPKYTEYEGAGHDIWQRAYNEPDLLPWIFKQHK